MSARHLRNGRDGENEAREYLEGQGLIVLETNWRHRKGELDLVCSEDEYIVFVEVKTRAKGSKELPGEALTWNKRRRLARAASAYLTVKKLWQRPCRFDLVAVTLDGQSRKVEHYPDVFEFPQTMGGSHSSWQPW
jgi:putative endonuclease